jgi:lipoprotein-anchoring transpeptidase ErfK/SrfK
MLWCARAAAIAAAMIVMALLPAGGARADIVVTVDKANQRMTVVVDGEHLYTWPVSTGIYNTPSGTYRPQSLSRYHRSHMFHNAPMPYAIFYDGPYAIHGTTAVSRLGGRASMGCVRLHPSNAAVLFALVKERGFADTRIVIRDSTVQAARR